MTIVGVLPVVYDRDNPDAEITAMLLTAKDAREACLHAQRHRAVVYRYAVTDDEECIHAQLVSSGK
jgi:hypothetical protein